MQILLKKFLKFFFLHFLKHLTPLRVNVHFKFKIFVEKMLLQNSIIEKKDGY